MVEESPVFAPLHERYGAGLGRFLAERVEVVEGDASQPGLGLSPEITTRLLSRLDLVVNSSGLTDFNPGLRVALPTNVDAAMHVLACVRRCHHPRLIHRA